MLIINLIKYVINFFCFNILFFIFLNKKIIMLKKIDYIFIFITNQYLLKNAKATNAN
jgi:hypothetical protein